MLRRKTLEAMCAIVALPVASRLSRPFATLWDLAIGSSGII
jgi:hypothetical protein